MYNLRLIPAVLNLFSGNTNVTTDSGLTQAIKTYYSDYLIDLAEPLLVHDQFGQKHPIPKGKGKTIEFRKYDPLPKALTALTEGVTPNGQKLSLKTLTATVAQYGGYVELSDILMLTAIDDELIQATKLLGQQAGLTLDTITREVLVGGTNVQLGEGSKNKRCLLVGGNATPSLNDYLTVDAIRMAVRTLKRMNAPKINGSYVGIVHPDIAYDLMSDDDWKDPHTYVDTENIYSGEIGRIGGVRFVETTEAKIFHGDDLASDSRNLAVNEGSSVTSGKVVTFDGGTVAENALVGRKVLINTTVYTVASNTASSGTSKLTFEETITDTIANDTVIYPGEGAAEGRDVYATLIIGDNAYGVTELTGGGLEHIVKQLGSGGTTDPLNQRATAGWKATKVAERLVEPYMVRIETTASFGGTTPAGFDDGWS